MKVCFYFKIIYLILLGFYFVRAQLPPPQSPCPADFTYEPREPGSDRWYGVVLIKSDVPLTGLRLEIQLTSRAIVLGNWDGTVSTKDDQLFQILNLEKKIEPGPATAVRFFVQYHEKPQSIIPALESIRLNGRMICPQDKAPTTIPPSIPEPEQSHVRESPLVIRDRFEFNAPNKFNRGNQKESTTKLYDTRSKDVERQRETSSTKERDSDYQNEDTRSKDVERQRETSSNNERDLEDQNEGSCGQVAILPRPLITYGQKTARGQWPWHGAVYKSVGVDLTYICGASLIHKQVALTAAHCVTSRTRNNPIDPENLVLYFGKYHLKIWSEGGVQDKQVKSIIIHPNFSISTLESDIAILILNSPTQYTDFVRPICLWDRNQTDLKYVEGQVGTTIGWGFDQKGHPTEELMQAKMPIVSQQQCLWSYPEFFAKFTSNYTFCAGFINGTSVCNGDSGGGLVFKKKNTNGGDYWRMRGLVSVSVSKKEEEVCDTNQYVVFTDVAKYLGWIENIIQDRMENENRQFDKDQLSAQYNHDDYTSRTTQRPTPITRRTSTNEYLLNQNNHNNNQNNHNNNQNNQNNHKNNQNNYNNNQNRASTNSGVNRNSDSFVRSSNSDVRRNSDSVPYTNKNQNNRSSQTLNDGSIDVRIH